MSLRIRLLLYVLCGAMVGFWLNVAVVFLAVGAQGASAAPAGLSELVELAYWPSWVWWRDPGYYFQPNLVSPHVVNIFG
jgi:hypothetical protein